MGNERLDIKEWKCVKTRAKETVSKTLVELGEVRERKREKKSKPRDGLSLKRLQRYCLRRLELALPHSLPVLTDRGECSDGPSEASSNPQSTAISRDALPS